MEFFVKNKILAMTSKMNLAHFSLASNLFSHIKRSQRNLKLETRFTQTFLGINSLSI